MMTSRPDDTDKQAIRRLAWGGFWLGFALGGFFDGILLHQVLQWHHLLAGVAPTETTADLRFQIVADGLFHVLHYILAVLGLCLLWSGRSALRRSTDRRIIAFSLIGFGTWHVLDAVVAHWTLQLHRIRMDVDNPLLWDIIWLIPFGIGALAAGLWMLRRTPGRGDAGPSGGRTTPLVASFITLTAGILAALPPAGALEDDMTLAVFRPGMSFSDIAAAADAVEGRLVWTDQSEGVWLIAVGPGQKPMRLYRHGAILVSNGPVAVGCLSWTGI